MKKNTTPIGTFGLILVLLSMSFIFAQPTPIGKQEGGMQAPPEAIQACQNKLERDSCSFIGLQGELVEGLCGMTLENTFVCMPNSESQKPEDTEIEPSEQIVKEKQNSEGFLKKIFNWFLKLFSREEYKTGEEKLESIDEEIIEDTTNETDNGEELETIVLTGGAVDTMQEECYNDIGLIITCSLSNFPGQDAQYKGIQASYQDNGDGTVTDLNTGLMWQQNPGEKKSYDDAVAEVDDFELAGYTDWRLPTIKEMYSLMDFRGTDPSGMQGDDTSSLTAFIDTDYFEFEYGDTSAGERVIDSQYGTSTKSISGTGVLDEETLFGVNFADGRIKGYGMTLHGSDKTFFFMYVRGDSYGVNDFVDNGDETIIDNSNGLMWMKGDSEEGMAWEDALNYCEDLSLAGYTDWRLPNAKELQYIVDYTKSPDATDSAAIDDIFEVSEITNENGEKDYAFYWTGTTHASYQGIGAGAAYVAFGRSLGYMNNQWVDVHGAGSQRSDPKIGDPEDYPTGHGPQGDAIRIYNYVRCVRK